MPDILIIDPSDSKFSLKENIAQRKKIAKFLKRQYNNGVREWVKGKKYPLDNNEHVMFKHDVYARQRKGLKKGVRYEFLSDKLLGEGGFGKVYEGYGVMKIQNDVAIFKEYGALINKKIKSKRAIKVSTENDFSDSIEFGEAFGQKPIIQLNNGKFVKVMKKAGDFDLSLLNTDLYRYYKSNNDRINPGYRLDLELTLNQKKALTIELLKCVKNLKITNLDKKDNQSGQKSQDKKEVTLVHQDIKPDNIRIGITTLPDGHYVFSAHLIDLDTIVQSGANPKQTPMTRNFSSPEVVNSSKCRKSIFSLKNEMEKYKNKLKLIELLLKENNLNENEEEQLDKLSDKFVNFYGNYLNEKDKNDFLSQEKEVLNKKLGQCSLNLNRQENKLDSLLTVTQARDVYSMGKVLAQLWKKELPATYQKASGRDPTQEEKDIEQQQSNLVAVSNLINGMVETTLDNRCSISQALKMAKEISFNKQQSQGLDIKQQFLNAVKLNDIKTVKSILNKKEMVGKNLSEIKYTIPLASGNELQFNALELAIQRGYKDIVKLLLDKDLTKIDPIVLFDLLVSNYHKQDDIPISKRIKIALNLIEEGVKLKMDHDAVDRFYKKTKLCNHLEQLLSERTIAWLLLALLSDQIVKDQKEIITGLTGKLKDANPYLNIKGNFATMFSSPVNSEDKKFFKYLILLGKGKAILNRTLSNEEINTKFVEFCKNKSQNFTDDDLNKIVESELRFKPGIVPLSEAKEDQNMKAKKGKSEPGLIINM